MKVYKHNDWEHITYTFNRKDLPVKAGTVVFEDGETAPIVVKRNTASYHEHGQLRARTVSQQLLMVVFTNRGKESLVPIEKFDDIKEIKQ